MNWPRDFGLADDHCADVLHGCYNLPCEPIKVLDIGANVGAFARWAIGRWPKCHVFCYEPHPDNFALLCKTVAHYQLDNAYHNNLAVSDTAGRLPLHENGNRGEWSFIHFEPKFTGVVEVDVIDAATLPDADFIKIDTEGAEPNIVKRLFDTGKLAKVNALVLEYHASVHVAPLIWFAQEAGLRLHSVAPHADHRGILKFLRPTAQTPQ
jgi:FkbM family methyltransferase